MKRLWMAAVMVLIIAAITISGVIYVKTYSATIDDHLAAAAGYARSERIEDAAKECRQAEEEWERAEKILRLFVNANELSEIGLTITTLEPFAEHDETGELLAQIKIARVQLIHMANMEAISH